MLNVIASAQYAAACTCSWAINGRIARVRLRKRDRIFWAWLSRLWSNWPSVLVIVKAETVIRWHQQGFKLYWRWKLRKQRPGRPKIDAEIRGLIRRMSRENPLVSRGAA